MGKRVQPPKPPKLPSDPEELEEERTTTHFHSVHPAPQHKQARLVFLAGPMAGRKIPLGASLLIGRGENAQLRLEHSSVSREHALLTRDVAGNFSIEDLRSSNGTHVNSKKVRRARVNPGDRIQIGTRHIAQIILEDSLQARLMDAERMEAIGRLSAGVNHDFNNLLAVLMSDLGVLGEMDGETTLSDPDIQDCLMEMGLAVKRAGELTGRLSSFARRDEQTFERLDLTTLCDEVVLLVNRALPSNIEVKAEVSRDLITEGCRAQLHRLLMNPCINAGDAMPNGGTLRVQASVLQSEELAKLPLTSSGSHLVIRVIDDGSGMDEATRAQVFEPFFTTKGEGLGTGLGLSTVSQIAREHGGLVEIESAPDKGTTVSVYLPGRVDTHTVPPAEPTGHFEMHGSGGRQARLLLVDDDPMVVRAMTRLLKRQGHDIVHAADGAEALDLLRGGATPDLVLLDVMMPNMGGEKCFVELRAMQPNLPVIFISGQCDVTKLEPLLGWGPTKFVRKPCHAHVLRRLVQTALQDAKA